MGTLQFRSRMSFDSLAPSLMARAAAEFREHGWRAGARACFFLAASRAGRKRFDFPLFGYPFRARPNQRKLGIDGLLYAHREDFGSPLMPFFRIENPESAFLDIGANYGFWSRFVLTDCRARNIRDISIVSFEPFPPNYELLIENMAYIPDSARSVCCEQLALSDKTGTCFMNRSNSDPGSTFAAGSGDVECPVATVDDYVASKNVRNVALVKIDVEGFELRVLRGARKTIARDKPVIVCEVIDSHLMRAGGSRSDLLEEVQKMGYSARPISGTDYLFHPAESNLKGA
jgi:FkbM family methyltransferase